MNLGREKMNPETDSMAFIGFIGLQSKSRDWETGRVFVKGCQDRQPGPFCTELNTVIEITSVVPAEEHVASGKILAP